MKTTPDWAGQWLVGANALFYGADPSSLQQAGGFIVHDVIRQPQQLFVATRWGLWHVGSEPTAWTQLHDETLTEVQGIAPRQGEPGVVAVSAYGLAFGATGEHGATHWQSRDDGLSLNERFSSAVIRHPDDPTKWIVGTEAGVRIFDETHNRWTSTTLSGYPCRVLIRAQDQLWAGTDGAGVWRSADGASWTQAGCGLEQDSVFTLAPVSDRLLAGTERGLCIGDGVSAWDRLGPSVLVSAVAAHPDPDGPWLAGTTPGGLWLSEDRGQRWRQVADVGMVHVILPPEQIS